MGKQSNKGLVFCTHKSRDFISIKDVLIPLYFLFLLPFDLELQELLSSLGSLEFSGGKASIDEVSKCSGDVSISLAVVNLLACIAEAAFRRKPFGGFLDLISITEILLLKGYLFIFLMIN